MPAKTVREYIRLYGSTHIKFEIPSEVEMRQMLDKFNKAHPLVKTNFAEIEARVLARLNESA